jgi:hypothetical protein
VLPAQATAGPLKTGLPYLDPATWELLSWNGDGDCDCSRIDQTGYYNCAGNMEAVSVDA